MVAEGIGQHSNGIAFLVSAGVVYEIMAAACSSPQTTELNAKARSKTLMKWVNIGVAQSALFVGISVAYDKNLARPILTGAGLAMALQYGLYAYAKRCGLNSNAPPTENYSSGGWG